MATKKIHNVFTIPFSIFLNTDMFMDNFTWYMDRHGQIDLILVDYRNIDRLWGIFTKSIVLELYSNGKSCFMGIPVEMGLVNDQLA